jgi:hypothetical protein
MYVARDVLASKTRGENEWEVSAPGRFAGLCQFSPSVILGAYEKHTQQERERVRGFTGVAVKNIRGLAAHETNQSACGGEP